MPQRAWETLIRDAVQGLQRPYTPENPPLVAPDHPPRGMGHRRPTDLATTPPPGHQKGKGQREDRRKGGEGRHKVTGTRPQEQGTEGSTTRGQAPTGGPPTLGEGKGRGDSTR